MKLSNSEKLQILQRWEDSYKEIDGVFSDLYNTLGCAPESKLFNSVYSAFDNYTDSVALLVGDAGGDGWLSWYLYDNDCGKRGHPAGVDGDKREINTVEDLLWVIDLTKSPENL